MKPATIAQELVTRHGWPKYQPNRTLIAWRQALGLTQAKVAERLGVTRATYAQLEWGRRRASPATLSKLAQIEINLHRAEVRPRPVRLANRSEP